MLNGWFETSSLFQSLDINPSNQDSGQDSQLRKPSKPLVNAECKKCFQNIQNFGQCHGKHGGNPCLIFHETKEAQDQYKGKGEISYA